MEKIMKNKKVLSEEHKKKIGLANSIANKGKHISPKTEFKKDHIPEHKGIGLPQTREENHYRWKGGSRATARRMAIRYGLNLSKCISCGTKGNMIIHHVDENFHNNKLDNLRVVCYKCHRQIHGFGDETRFQKGHKVSQITRDKIARANTKHGRYSKNGKNN